MLLRHRPAPIESIPGNATERRQPISDESVAVLRWLKANKVEYVLIGAVARAIRGGAAVSGPIAIVPAPYGRNLERLARTLMSAHARMRVDGELDTTPVKMTAEKLSRGTRWTLRCGIHDLDIERGTARDEDVSIGTPRYQELLFEAARFAVEPGLSVEVASPEDIEHFAHLRRTGVAPEIRISRGRQGATKD